MLRLHFQDNKHLLFSPIKTMSISKYLASQLRKPSGLMGKVFISRMLNRENEKMNDATLTLLDIRDTDRILEVGFGGGFLLFKIMKSKLRQTVYGADFSAAMVEHCGKNMRKFIAQGSLQLDCANVRNLPYAANQFTKIATVNTIYFWDDFSEAIKELKRVLDDNGVLVIAFGDKESMAKLKITHHGFSLYTPEEIQKVLEAQGFKINHIKQGQDNSSAFFVLSATKVC